MNWLKAKTSPNAFTALVFLQKCICRMYAVDHYFLIIFIHKIDHFHPPAHRDLNYYIILFLKNKKESQKSARAGKAKPSPPSPNFFRLEGTWGPHQSQLLLKTSSTWSPPPPDPPRPDVSLYTLSRVPCPDTLETRRPLDHDRRHGRPPPLPLRPPPRPHATPLSARRRPRRRRRLRRARRLLERRFRWRKRRRAVRSAPPPAEC